MRRLSSIAEGKGKEKVTSVFFLRDRKELPGPTILSLPPHKEEKQGKNREEASTKNLLS